MHRSFLLILLAGILNITDLSSQSKESTSVNLLPEINGILKTKVEYDLDNSLTRFEVRNARFGFKGKVNKYFSYKAQIDLSDEGIIKMLDAYVMFTPLPDLDIYLGQRKVPFSTDYMRSPADNIFANRSFLSKYINNGLRDIGFFVNYKTSGNVPVDIFVGAVNGTGNNDPQWITKPNIAGRISAGKDKGIRIAGNLYLGESLYQDKLTMLGGELRYSSGSLFIESEYITRSWTDSLSTRIRNDGLYIHSYYNFFRNDKIISLITPTARWDIIGNSVFGKEVDAKRLTLGINTGFFPKQFYAEIRLNYENYFKGNLPVHTDKVTLEFIARF
jgi:hypothetical protein